MNNKRIHVVFGGLIFAMLLVVLRLFYWQVIAAERLQAVAESQHLTSFEIPAQRGEIRTSDGFPIAANRQSYLIWAYTPQLTRSGEEIAGLLAPILAPRKADGASESAETEPPSLADREEVIQQQLNRDDVLWMPLVRNAEKWQKEAVEKLELKGIGSESTYARDYPEATMAASLLGFVGSDTAGNPKGYFGLEGYYDLELKGRPGIVRHERDASGKPILIGRFDEIEAKNGRTLTLNVNRAIQNIVERELADGLRRYRAKSGEVVILDPRTGAVLAMASLPTYDPARFGREQASLYRNPIISETYEPGSTFKVLVMSAALDANAVEPDTKCDVCNGPLKVGGYTIRTWNNEYRQEQSMREVIEHSDNVGMVFTARQLGVEKLYDYLERFGIGEKTGVDLEEEATTSLRDPKGWKEIDLATASFGQGVAVTGMQMVRAVGAVANNGIMMVPQVVHSAEDGKTRTVEPQVARRVISEETAREMTEMLVNAVENGEAKWAKPKGYDIAGKTGTAQIPVAGHYDEEKTIASFVGFAPADDPKFVMLVKLREPETSPWGSETAAPLWFSIARQLFTYLGIPSSAD